MITLYGVYRSRASRPLWLLGELDLAFTHVPVIQAYRLADPGAKDAPLNTSSPEYLAINPQGQIPCLTDADLTLTESMAITLYLAQRHGGDIGPKSANERALMINWALFAATGIEDRALSLMQTMAGPMAETPEGRAEVAATAQKLRRPLALIEAHLAAHPYLMGDRFTVADINASECVRYAQGHPTLLAEFPLTEAWMLKCQSRPAFKDMWAARMAEPT
jgi:glutathione S-transferase